MSETNDANNQQQRSCEEHPAQLNDADITPWRTRLIELEKAFKAHIAEAHSADTPKDKDLLDRIKSGERWMIFLTFVIVLVSAFQAGVSVFQAHETSVIARSTSQQTDQLIAASQYSASAAEKNAQAAGSFAESAKRINQGVNNAVSRLQIQADATERMRKTAESNASEMLQATKENFRVEQRPWLYIIDESVTHQAIKWDEPRNGASTYTLHLTCKTSVRLPQQTFWGVTSLQRLHLGLIAAIKSEMRHVRMRSQLRP